MLDEKMIQCPYCWESFTLLVDASEGDDQSYVYDCEVCCRPIDVRVNIHEENVQITTKRGQEV